MSSFAAYHILDSFFLVIVLLYTLRISKETCAGRPTERSVMKLGTPKGIKRYVCEALGRAPPTPDATACRGECVARAGSRW
jgi:hypothetical protein